MDDANLQKLSENSRQEQVECSKKTLNSERNCKKSEERIPNGDLWYPGIASRSIKDPRCERGCLI